MEEEGKTPRYVCLPCNEWFTVHNRDRHDRTKYHQNNEKIYHRQLLAVARTTELPSGSPQLRNTGSTHTYSEVTRPKRSLICCGFDFQNRTDAFQRHRTRKLHKPTLADGDSVPPSSPDLEENPNTPVQVTNSSNDYNLNDGDTRFDRLHTFNRSDVISTATPHTGAQWQQPWTFDQEGLELNDPATFLTGRLFPAIQPTARSVSVQMSPNAMEIASSGPHLNTEDSPGLRLSSRSSEPPILTPSRSIPCHENLHPRYNHGYLSQKFLDSSGVDPVFPPQPVQEASYAYDHESPVAGVSWETDLSFNSYHFPTKHDTFSQPPFCSTYTAADYDAAPELPYLTEAAGSDDAYSFTTTTSHRYPIPLVAASDSPLAAEAQNQTEPSMILSLPPIEDVADSEFDTEVSNAEALDSNELSLLFEVLSDPEAEADWLSRYDHSYSYYP